MNLTINELTWFRYRCNNCSKVYKSTSDTSICPDCKSEDVTRMPDKSGVVG
jgi:rRNA maturation endonuclease Nob1